MELMAGQSFSAGAGVCLENVLFSDLRMSAPDRNWCCQKAGFVGVLIVLYLLYSAGSSFGSIFSSFLKNVQWKWGQNARLVTGKSCPLPDCKMFPAIFAFFSVHCDGDCWQSRAWFF